MTTAQVSFAPHLTSTPRVTVSYSHDTGEYQARIENNPDDTYFTDDPEDAIHTAIAMAKHAHPGKQIRFIIHRPRKVILAVLLGLPLTSPTVKPMELT